MGDVWWGGGEDVCACVDVCVVGYWVVGDEEKEECGRRTVDECAGHGVIPLGIQLLVGFVAVLVFLDDFPFVECVEVFVPEVVAVCI